MHPWTKREREKKNMEKQQKQLGVVWVVREGNHLLWNCSSALSLFCTDA